MSTAAHHPVLVAIGPLLDAVGGEIVEPADIEAGDIPIDWHGETVGAVRLGSLSEALERMIGQIEAELGGRLAVLGRVDKQLAVRLLDERGAFLLRKSIDEVAQRMGVSRITIYNYLTTVRTP